jgi:hypothetical protein
MQPLFHSDLRQAEFSPLFACFPWSYARDMAFSTGSREVRKLWFHPDLCSVHLRGGLNRRRCVGADPHRGSGNSKLKRPNYRTDLSCLPASFGHKVRLFGRHSWVNVRPKCPLFSVACGLLIQGSRTRPGSWLHFIVSRRSAATLRAEQKHRVAIKGQATCSQLRSYSCLRGTSGLHERESCLFMVLFPREIVARRRSRSDCVGCAPRRNI